MEDCPQEITRNSDPSLEESLSSNFGIPVAEQCFFSFIATFFSVFDVPVFWPVLLLYFVVLFVLTMKRQIKHMLKHKYVPFSFGKAVYTGTGKNSK
jgi:hypothetical protein